jgi:hypothetical protein
VSRCRFCANIFSAKPTFTHTYWEKAIRVSRWRFGGINMFGGFHVLAGSSIELQPEKRCSRLAVGWNVWGFHELGLFWRVPQSNYNPKKMVQLSGHWLQYLGGSMNSDYFGGFVAMFFGGFLDQITNYNLKKGTVIWPLVGMSTTYF